MNPRFVKYYSIVTGLIIISGGIILYQLLPGFPATEKPVDPAHWVPPEINLLPPTAESKEIRFGKELIVNTSYYFGPKGIISHISNGMNCGNCHLEGGTRYNGSSFASVASTYPKFRERSGKIESIEYRINECFERSLNGSPLDSNSREMKAMVSYLKWLGKDVPKGIKPYGSGTPEIPVLNEAADAGNGEYLYMNKCQRCHGKEGKGLINADSSGYIYPPLWGPKSYNVSAGLYRLSRFAGFIKYNMPYTSFHTFPQLSDKEAWDLAAFVNSRERPEKYFKYDWPDIRKKPFDYPFGPYSDSFSEKQHKFGPFPEIKAAKSKK